MADKKGGDPVQKTVATLEARVNELGKAVFGSENFGKVMNSAVTTQARVQKTFSERMAKNLHFYNMPSQDDIVQLAEQCGRIEERMVAIESMLHQLLNQKSGTVRKGPARTKKPKSATRSKKPDAK
ncbi:MAG: hypothetical protein NXH78_07165 [Hyphomonadaceae bacterium]|nr:hypothetical protein [Hyphomonadaceae bacterium]